MDEVRIRELKPGDWIELQQEWVNKWNLNPYIKVLGYPLLIDRENKLSVIILLDCKVFQLNNWKPITNNKTDHAEVFFNPDDIKRIVPKDLAILLDLATI